MRRLLAFGVICGFVILWHAVTVLADLPPQILPKPTDAISGVAELISERNLAEHIVASLLRVFAGFGLALLVGVPLGLFLGLHPRVAGSVDPLIQLLRPISPIAWIPLALVWFGIGNAPAVFIIFITALFPMLISSTSAVREIDPLLFRMASNFESSRWNLLLKIVFPGSFPQVVISARVALGISWVIIVAAEMVGMRSGLGYLILDSRNFLRTDLVVATMAVIGLIGFSLDRSVRSIEQGVRRRWGGERSGVEGVSG